MSIEVETKDCTGLSDVELAELADLCAESPFPHEIGAITKEAESWVLVSQAREDGKLKGFTFSTLERIGGTPCVLIGMGSIKRSSKRDTVLRAIMQEELRRAYGEALLLLGGLLFARERHAEAAEAYRKAIAHDGFLEEAHRGLMRSQAALGERGRAIRHYEELVELLDEQLDTPPAPETSALHERLRAGEEV